jgi:hypothetical protein
MAYTKDRQCSHLIVAMVCGSVGAAHNYKYVDGRGAYTHARTRAMATQHLDKEVVVVTAASVGLIGTVFTRQPLFAPAVYFVFYGFLSLWAKVARIPSESQADHAAIMLESAGLPVLAMVVGVFVGTTFIWSLRTPKLIDIDIFYSSRQPYRASASWRSIFYPWHLMWFFAIFVGVVGIYAVIDRLDEVPPDIEGLDPGMSLALGITLIVIGSILLLVSGFYACTHPMPSGKPGGYTIAYTPVLVIIAAVPYLFYWTREELSYYSVLLVLGAGVLAYLVFGSLALCCGFDMFRTQGMSLWRRVEFWLALFFVHMTLVVPSLFAGEFYQDSRETMVILAALGAGIVVLLLVYGLCVDRRHNEPKLLPNVVKQKTEPQYDTVDDALSVADRWSLDKLSFNTANSNSTHRRRI